MLKGATSAVVYPAARVACKPWPRVRAVSPEGA